MPRHTKSKPLPEGLVKALAANASAGIDAPGLLNAFVDQWGGRQALARDLYAEFDAAKPGSMIRQRILEMISRLTIVVTSQDMAKQKGTGDMSDEELIQAAASLMKRIGVGRAEEATGPDTTAGITVDPAADSSGTSDSHREL